MKERNMEDYISSFVTVNKSQIYYELAGKGHPLVLLHGFDPFDLRFWDWQFSTLAQLYRVLRFDHRGYGKSPASTEPYSREHDLFQLLQQLEIRSAYVLDMGGAGAFHFVHAYPQSVDALIFASPQFKVYRSIFITLTGLPFAMKEWYPVYKALKQGNEQKACEVFLKIEDMTLMTVSTEIYQWTIDLLHESIHLLKDAPKMAYSDLEVVKRLKYVLKEIQVPSLIIEGELASPRVRSACKMLEQDLRQAQKVNIPHSHILLNIENPDMFNQAVLTFLAQLF